MANRIQTINVTKKLRIHETQQGNSFLECNTNVGLAAFWGSQGNMRNIQALGLRSVPFAVRCGCRDANKEKFPAHEVWIPESSVLEFIDGDSKS